MREPRFGKSILIAPLTFLYIFTGVAFAQGIDDAIGRGFTLKPAIGVRIIDVDIKRNSDGAEAQLTDDPGDFSISFSASFPEYFFGESNWGFSYFIEYSTFRTDKQIADTGDGDFSPKNLGTSTSGTFLFVVPILFWKKTIPGVGAMKIGGGLGFGQAKIKGNALFGPNRMVSPADTKEPINVEDNSAVAFLFFAELPLIGLDKKPVKDMEMGLRIGRIIFNDSNFRYAVEDFLGFVRYVITF